MRRYIPLVVIAAVAVAIGIGVAVNKKDKSDNDNTETTNTTSVNPSPSQNNPSPSPSSASSATDGVEIEDMAFTPATITVKKGTKVTWTNNDSIAHTVTADSGNGLDSQLLSQGDSYSFTFDTIGEFSYHCAPHPNMTGKVIVTE